MARLLLIEDNEMNRDMLSRRLAKRGYQVLTATDGGEGLSLAVREKPDLIIIDMSLPVLDGWEVARRLRNEPATRRIPLIALTAHVLSGDRERALEAGCDEYDEKPVEFPRLLEKIAALLARDRPPA